MITRNELAKISFEHENVVINKVGDGEITFILDTVPFCCGLYEVGEIYNNNLSVEDILIVFNKVSDLAKQKGKTILVNTIQEQKEVEQALAQSTKYTLVKRFRNNKRGNRISMWVSN